MQYSHDIGDKHILDSYHQRFMELVYKIAFKKIVRTGTPPLMCPPDWPHKLRLRNCRFSLRSTWRCIISFELIPEPTEPGGGGPFGVQEENGYEVTDHRALAIAHVRAWLHVAFRTRLFSEYVWPYIVAAIPLILFFFPDMRTMWV